MLLKLVKYEMSKKWKLQQQVLLGYLLLQTLLLILTRGLLWDSHVIRIYTEDTGDFEGIGVPYVLSMLLFFAVAIFIGLFSIFEGIYRFWIDVSGRHSVLELMLPIISWKKIVSKIIVNLCSNLVCIGLSMVSITLFIILNSNFDKSIVDGIVDNIKQFIQSPGRSILASIYLVFCVASFYAIIFCCVAFSKSVSHKSKFSILIGLASLACFIAVCSLINTFLVESVPIISYSLLGAKDSLSSTIMSMLIFFGALFGTSWLMEKKMEQ